MTQEEMQLTLDAMGAKALSASRALAVMAPEVKTAFLLRMADLIEEASASIIEANAADLEYGRAKGLSDAMLDRLKLDEKRVAKVEDVVNVGDEILVMVTEIDDQNRINLSRKDAIAKINAKREENK